MPAPHIATTEFKARCLKLLDDVARSKAPLVITKHGRPVARLVPIEPDRTTELFGLMRGSVALVGDVVAPLDEPWDADR